ncbi:hypothetical protein Caci_6617 [Catenulispora acidiphila DSM 44928]|uniref:HTH cro/C1-type domain-containing protein n=1 Tax=Catenulispora acidiphila (strain DSM 44928 / JCM 14897 / NBRC 102108 / NRRL B-24433 / ID139908) TaxID=479433 RepID=C7PYH3_CATAD|nr:XRE family transcriptional regulator [Catenulispora acidiphila]ACU75463.1 hypothetical protein Caci_6617 [Catenulispora acidiphila DSM 44928]
MTAPQPDIPGEVTRLAAELRRLREQTGLSFTALSEQTPYSKSAWQRYLTAKVLAPWPAVQELGRLAGEQEPRLRALWELAESATRRRAAVMAGPGGTEPPETTKATKATEPTETTNSPNSARPAESATPETRTETKPETGPAFPRERRARVAVAMILVATVVAAVLGVAGVRLLHGTGVTGGTTSKVLNGRFSVICTSGSCDPTCQGAACTGQDPQMTLCGVQGLPLHREQTASGVGVEILYNPRCRAAWASFWNTQIGDTLTVAAPGQPTESVRVSDPRYTSGFTYTPMVFVAGSGTALKACITSPSGVPDCSAATAS